MGKFLNSKSLLIIIFQIIYSYSQSNYYSTLTTDFSKLNTTYSSVVISESKDLGACSCDLTPSACDYQCCCDTDCPSTITSIWVNDPNNVCLDKKGKENDYLTHCFNENILYYYNRKRGMKEYRDPVSNLFCVTFDNSSIMGQFYRDITALTKTSITSIYQNYVDKQIKRTYYSNMNTGLILNKAYYAVGDYIKIKLGSGVNDFAFDGKLFLFQSGSFGECVKTNPVKFLVPNQKIKCGFKLKTLGSCTNHQWQSFINSEASVASTPSANPSYNKIQIRNVLLRDYSTGTLSIGDKSTAGQTTLSYSGTDCICNNLLEQAEFSFMVSLTSFNIFAVYVDLILAQNVKGSCNQKYIMTQSYSSVFLNSFTDSFVRSGSPGYIENSRLLVAYNTTSILGVTQFMVPKDGFYMLGRKDDGTCSEIQTDGLFVKSQFDTPILYGVNSIYTCVKKFKLEEFQYFCENKQWSNYVLYNFIKNLQYVGIFGSASNTYLKDWTEVINDYSSQINKSTWYSNNSTCIYPNTIFLDILTSKAGAVNNPQNYVVAARLQTYSETVPFLSNNSNDILPFTMKFIVNYVPLADDQLTATRSAPNIIPGLPTDIATPLISLS